MNYKMEIYYDENITYKNITEEVFSKLKERVGLDVQITNDKTLKVYNDSFVMYLYDRYIEILLTELKIDQKTPELVIELLTEESSKHCIISIQIPITIDKFTGTCLERYFEEVTDKKNISKIIPLSQEFLIQVNNNKYEVMRLKINNNLDGIDISIMRLYKKVPNLNEFKRLHTILDVVLDGQFEEGL